MIDMMDKMNDAKLQSVQNRISSICLMTSKAHDRPSKRLRLEWVIIVRFGLDVNLKEDYLTKVFD